MRLLGQMPLIRSPLRSLSEDSDSGVNSGRNGALRAAPATGGVSAAGAYDGPRPAQLELSLCAPRNPT
jgi:hypothetical protein